MKFKDFLSSVGEFSGEVYTTQWESRFSFEWNADTKFTDAGKKYYKKILDSDIRIDNTNVQLLDDSITEVEYDDFMETIAGYSSITKYDRLITHG
jgi:hypothetical protein